MSDVMLGHIHDEFFNARTVRCLSGLNAERRPGEGTLYVESGGGNLDKGRNLLVQKFLQSEYDWFLQIDTDQFFGLEQYDRLVETAKAKFPDPVSGLYFANERPPRAAMYRWKDNGHAESVTDWEDHEIVEVDGFGAGFLMVHREVYEKMNHPDEYAGRAGSWFTQNALGPAGQLLNEDSSFCIRAQQHGYKLWVDTDVFVGHIKDRILGWE